MTAPNKPTGAPSWICRAHVLSPDARGVLIAALGFPAESQDPNLLNCLQKVEYWLGFYPGGKKAIDNAPSAGAYRRDLEEVKKSALNIMALLNSPDAGINPYTRDFLSTHFEEAVLMTGPDGIGKVTSANGALVIACNSALKALEAEKMPTQGRKKSGAREHVLTMLLELYSDYSTRSYEKRVRQGAVECISPFERHELIFIRAAFSDICEDTFFNAIDPNNADGTDPDAHANTRWLELIKPIRKSSEKLRARVAQSAERRPPKKAKKSP